MAITDELDPRDLKRLYYAIRQVLMSIGGQRSPGKHDDHGRPREKIRHQCLFHDDPEPSADYYADEGWYYCHGCGRVFSLDDVVLELRALGRSELDSFDIAVPSLEKKNARHGRDGRGTEDDRRSPHHHSKFGEPDVVYIYRHPGGSVSHYRLRWNRWEDGEYVGKDLRTQGADHSWRDVAITWPVYGDTTLWPGLNIIVCEGEKAVNEVNARAELYNDALIVAVTCGSAQNLQQNGRLLADRLAELAPARVLLWHDNDKRMETRRWIAPLQRALEAHGVTVGRVDLSPLGLPAKAGPDDYAAQGGQLADVFGATFTPAGAPTLDQLGRDTVVTTTGQFLMPGTRRLFDLKPEHLEALWWRHTGGQVPKPAALKLLRAQLMNRAADSRTEVSYRRWVAPDGSCVYWRPHPDGHCYRISEDGIRTAYDPPDTLLMVGDRQHFDPSVDENGTMEDLEHLCARFGLDEDQAILVLGWLVCALLGLQTPILVLRGESGAGKTTLARLLMSIVEPAVPYTDLSSDSRIGFDQRQLVNTLKMSLGVILDNVTKFSSEAEDMLSRLVTGYGAHQRILHTDQIEALHMRRAMIVTTIHWDVKKGDLATRLLPIHLEDRNEYIPERKIEQVFTRTIQRIRGFVFDAAVEFFQQRDLVPATTNIRIADLGYVLAALGYDAPYIANRLFQMRSDILNETDYWLGAVVDFYRSQYGEDRPGLDSYFLTTASDIVGHMVNLGCENVPSHHSPALARWLRERNPMFKDSGFVVEYVKTSAFRGWRFRTIRRMDWE